jgi:purine-binding chemotaxis protein CheW
MEVELGDIQMACFTLGEKLFAVDIMRIKEIMVPQQLSSLPRASELLDGVINLRGNVIPVLNMRKRFSMPDDDNATKSRKLLIVSLVGRMLALMVDDVMEVVSVPVRQIKPPIPLTLDAGMEYIAGVCLLNDRVFMIIDIDSLLGPADLTGCSTMSRVL